MSASLATFLQSGATDAWSEDAHPFLYYVAEYGPWVAGLVLALLVARALVRFPRYRAVSVLGDAEQLTVRAAVVEAEKRTIGEIVPVVLERSDDHPGARWTFALVALLVTSALLEAWLAWDAPHVLLFEQLAIGAAAYGLAWLLPDLQRTFVSEARATEMAEEQAHQEFFRLGLHETRAKTGVLVFVSLFERRVVVIGDEGIAAKIDAERWAELRELVLAGIRRGSLAQGLVDGVREAGSVLAEHHPRLASDPNELPDRLVVRAR